jgi:hypothetical protein
MAQSGKVGQQQQKSNENFINDLDEILKIQK